MSVVTAGCTAGPAAAPAGWGIALAAAALGCGTVPSTWSAAPEPATGACVQSRSPSCNPSNSAATSVAKALAALVEPPALAAAAGAADSEADTADATEDGFGAAATGPASTKAPTRARPDATPAVGDNNRPLAAAGRKGGSGPIGGGSGWHNSGGVLQASHTRLNTLYGGGGSSSRGCTWQPVACAGAGISGPPVQRGDKHPPGPVPPPCHCCVMPSTGGTTLLPTDTRRRLVSGGRLLAVRGRAPEASNRAAAEPTLAPPPIT